VSIWAILFTGCLAESLVEADLKIDLANILI
jgi:hypothetical protein